VYDLLPVVVNVWVGVKVCDTVGVRLGVGDCVTDPVKDTLSVRVGGVKDAEGEGGVRVTEGLELCDALSVLVVRDVVGLRVCVGGDTLWDKEADEVRVVVGR